MNVRVALLPWVLRCGLRRVLLDRLAGVTARALGSAPASFSGLAWEARLERYARTTAAQADALLQAGDPKATEAAARELWRGARELGASARRLLGLRGPDEALAALCAFYGQIGIRAACGGGELRVRHCVFAEHFGRRTCELVAALDDGFAAGLSGGGLLRFTRRITAGDACCLARLQAATAR